MGFGSTSGGQDYPAATVEFDYVRRVTESVSILIIMLAVMIGGRGWMVALAHFHGVAIAGLGTMGVMIVYTFRRSYLLGGPLARLNATRDAAFLAAIAAAIAFVVSPARWALGATVVAVEFALIVELLTHLAPPAPSRP